MKTSLFISLIILGVISCKKKDVSTCDITMPEIAGNYKLIKFESVSYATGSATDLTSTLTSCELSGIYNFNIDSTAIYTELTNCNGSGNGTWKVSETWLYTAFTSGDGNRISSTLIESWNCSTLVLITRYPSVTYNYRFTLRRL